MSDKFDPATHVFGMAYTCNTTGEIHYPKEWVYDEYEDDYWHEEYDKKCGYLCNWLHRDLTRAPEHDLVPRAPQPAASVDLEGLKLEIVDVVNNGGRAKSLLEGLDFAIAHNVIDHLASTGRLALPVEVAGESTAHDILHAVMYCLRKPQSDGFNRMFPSLKPMVETAIKRGYAQPATPQADQVSALEALEDIIGCTHRMLTEKVDKLAIIVRTALSQKPQPVVSAEDLQRKNKVIAEAALCIFENKDGAITDTIWMDAHRFGGTTLYEHLVGEIDIELTGEYETDLAILTAAAGETK